MLSNAFINILWNTHLKYKRIFLLMVIEMNNLFLVIFIFLGSTEDQGIFKKIAKTKTRLIFLTAAGHKGYKTGF